MSRTAGLLLVILAALLGWRQAALAAEPAPPLPRLAKLDPATVTVSGVSSGGFFAHQFHVAYSSLVQGAGLVAAGPYACAEQAPSSLAFNPFRSVIVALAVCSRAGRRELGFIGGLMPERPDPDEAVAAARKEHRRGSIDALANLAGSRVWLFSGGKDEIVPPATVHALQSFYEAMGVRTPALRVVEVAGAAHGLPIGQFPEQTALTAIECGRYGSPFLIRCGEDAPRDLLQHLYPAGFRDAGTPERVRLLRFDQRAFFDPDDASVSMSEAGYIYVPASCGEGAPSGPRCRLHVAFHGCRQAESDIGDDFYWDAGYNRWAGANRIVVLYPQAIAWTRSSDPSGLSGNPNGCWDWWGYSGPGYYRQDGKQMQAVKAMIDRLIR